jgi:histone H3/H4
MLKRFQHILTKSFVDPKYPEILDPSSHKIHKPLIYISLLNQNEVTNTLPATVQKIVTEILPPSSGLAFGKDARDLLIECCVEFITLISSEANEISEKESKKTIACEHITKALEQLGFGEYVASIMEVASEHKEQLKVLSPTLFFIL